MSQPPPPAKRKLDPLAAFLSFLLPGLGQVLQGRIAKGLLFFVCLYGLFFYGMWMGRMKNVWLPESTNLPAADLPAAGKLDGVPKALYHRPQFLGQFWIGMAAWPAMVQYALADPTAKPDEGPKLEVIGDDGPKPAGPKSAPVIGHYMQTPSELELNQLQRDGDKGWDLGWVYTVVAGVLNILVIYDALAGPVVKDDEPAPTPTPPGPKPEGAGS